MNGMQRQCLQAGRASLTPCNAHKVSSHVLRQHARCKPSLQHLCSSQQQVARHVAAAGQPDRLNAKQPSELASGPDALQLCAELQQQRADQQDDSSLQRLVVQAGKLPNQADQLWGDPSDRESREVALVEPASSSYADLDYLSVSPRQQQLCGRLAGPACKQVQ
jgi:hypothetical protein